MWCRRHSFGPTRVWAATTMFSLPRSIVWKAQGQRSAVVARLQNVSTTQVDCSGLRGTPGDKIDGSNTLAANRLGSEVMRQHQVMDLLPEGFKSRRPRHNFLLRSELSVTSKRPSPPGNPFSFCNRQLSMALRPQDVAISTTSRVMGWCCTIGASCFEASAPQPGVGTKNGRTVVVRNTRTDFRTSRLAPWGRSGGSALHLLESVSR
jgi:hypothetical protein